MSYSRWLSSDWYIFWCSTSEDSSKEDQTLAIWCASVEDLPHYKYSELKNMNGDYSQIPGYSQCDEIQRKIADKCIENFLKDVEVEFSKKGE